MNLKVIAVAFERAPKAHYSSKVRVTLEATAAVTAWAPQWRIDSRTGGHGVHVQKPFGSGVERKLASGAWEGKTLPQVTMQAGEQIRVWVGLDETVGEEQLQAMRGRIGTLVVPTTNEAGEWSDDSTVPV